MITLLSYLVVATLIIRSWDALPLRRYHATLRAFLAMASAPLIHGTASLLYPESNVLALLYPFRVLVSVLGPWLVWMIFRMNTDPEETVPPPPPPVRKRYGAPELNGPGFRRPGNYDFDTLDRFNKPD